MERHNQLKILDFIKHSRCLRYVAVPSWAGGEGGLTRLTLGRPSAALRRHTRDGSSRRRHGMKGFNKMLLRKAKRFMLSTWPVAFLGRRDDFN